MTEPFWDELGIGWKAVPAPAQQARKLEGRFRRQSAQIRLAVFLAALFGTLGSALGVFTLWQGWRLGAVNFGVRGVAVLSVAAILWLVAATLWSVRRDDARSLKNFAERGLARARRSRMAAAYALAGCSVVAVLGVVGTILRTAADRPPALSPYIDLAILALMALVLEALRRRFRSEEARFEYLFQALGQAD